MRSSQTLQWGVKAYQAGNVGEARHYFLQAVREQPQDELAWAWLSNVADDPEDRRRCLHRVVSINPGNSTATRELERLEGRNWAKSIRSNILQSARRPLPGIVLALMGLLNNLGR